MTAWKIFSRVVAVVLISAISLSSSAQQVPTPALTKRAMAAKRTAEKLAPHAHISVIPNQGSEEFGEFLSHDGDGITFRDVDQKIDVTMQYSEIRKLKSGYGGYNWPTHRHTDRTKNIIVMAATMGALLGLVFAVALTRD